MMMQKFALLSLFLIFGLGCRGPEMGYHGDAAKSDQTDDKKPSDDEERLGIFDNPSLIPPPGFIPEPEEPPHFALPYPYPITGGSGGAKHRCGNGVREHIEECDDGNLKNGDACNAQYDIKLQSDHMMVNQKSGKIKITMLTN